MIDQRQNSRADVQRDILARFLEVHNKDPSSFTFTEILGLTTTNLYVDHALIPRGDIC